MHVIEQRVCILIAGIPPSVNHYKQPTKRRDRDGNLRTAYKLTPEAILWRDLVWLAARGRTIAPEGKRERDQVRYQLTATIYLGAGQRGDGDNFWKCIADALQYCGVIHSDSRVQRWVLEVRDTDRANPRTEIAAELMPS